MARNELGGRNPVKSSCVVMLQKRNKGAPSLAVLVSDVRHRHTRKSVDM